MVSQSYGERSVDFTLVEKRLLAIGQEVELLLESLPVLSQEQLTGADAARTEDAFLAVTSLGKVHCLYRQWQDALAEMEHHLDKLRRSARLPPTSSSWS